MKKRNKKFKFKIDILSMIFAIIFFMCGCIYQNFINDRMFNEKEKMLHSMLGEFLGKKITFYTKMDGTIYMFIIGKENCGEHRKIFKKN